MGARKAMRHDEETEPRAPIVRVRMLMAVREGVGDLGPVYGAGAEPELPRAQALDWCLRGFCDPSGWAPGRDELMAHGAAALAAIEAEAIGTGRGIEGWMKVPANARRLARLEAMTSEPRGGSAA
jgi:hypothetical protein